MRELPEFKAAVESARKVAQVNSRTAPEIVTMLLDHWQEKRRGLVLALQRECEQRIFEISERYNVDFDTAADFKIHRLRSECAARVLYLQSMRVTHGARQFLAAYQLFGCDGDGQ